MKFSKVVSVRTSLFVGILTIVWTVAFPNAALGRTSCEKVLLDNTVLLEKMKLRLSQSKNISVVEGIADLRRDNSYDGNQQRVYLNPQAPVWVRLRALHHEAVHVANDYNFRVDPNARTAAFGITFTRKGAALHAQIPWGYAYEFGFDEIIAQWKTSLYTSRLAKEAVLSGNLNKNELSAEAESFQLDSLALARVAVSLLKKLRSQIMAAMAGGSLSMTRYLYAPNTPQHFLICSSLPVPHVWVPAPEICIPIYDASPLAMEIPDLIPKLLEVCEQGIKIAEDFIRTHYAP